MTLIHSPCPLHLIQCSLSRSSLLNIALSKWEYLRQVVRAGHLGNVISALGDLHASGLLSSKTETARDVEETLFWLNRFAHDFEESPAKMEEITLQAPLDSQKVRSLPLPHSLSEFILFVMQYQEAFQRLAASSSMKFLPTLKVLGGYGQSEWPADRTMFKVTCNYFCLKSK